MIAQSLLFHSPGDLMEVSVMFYLSGDFVSDVFSLNSCSTVSVYEINEYRAVKFMWKALL